MANKQISKELKCNLLVREYKDKVTGELKQMPVLEITLDSGVRFSVTPNDYTARQLLALELKSIREV